MLQAANLRGWLCAHREDVLVLAQRPALPAPLVQVQDAPGLGLEVRIAREDPAAVLPRSDGVLVQPAPDRAVADSRDQARALSVSSHVGDAESRQRQAKVGRQFAGEGLDLNREFWGEGPEGDPGGLSLRGPPIVP